MKNTQPYRNTQAVLVVGFFGEPWAKFDIHMKKKLYRVCMKNTQTYRNTQVYFRMHNPHIYECRYTESYFDG